MDTCRGVCWEHTSTYLHMCAGRKWEVPGQKGCGTTLGYAGREWEVPGQKGCGTTLGYAGREWEVPGQKGCGTTLGITRMELAD